MKIMYSIYNNSKYLFCTYDKGKADRFIETYNSDESDYYPDRVHLVIFKSSSNIEKTEIEADRIIDNYWYFIELTVDYNKENEEFILINRAKRYLDRYKIKDYESINYSDSGYRITILIIEELLEIGLDYSKITDKYNKIINQNLISRIEESERELNNSLKGSILYIVTKKDYEYSPRLFKTFSKDKVESFVREYNQINSEDEEDRVGYFSINLSQIEEEADSVIEEYLTAKKIVYIEVNKEGNFRLLKTEIKHCGEDLEDIFVNIKEQSFVVTFVISKDYPVDLNDSVIINKIKELKEKHYYLFDNR